MQPISDVTKLDLVGERHDGGVDMGIVAQGPLDASPETLSLVERKVRNYVREALDSSFRESFGGVSPERIRIFVDSRFHVDPAVRRLISGLASEVAEYGLRLELREY